MSVRYSYEYKTADLRLIVVRFSGQAPGLVLRLFHVFLLYSILSFAFIKKSHLKHVIIVKNPILMVM